MEITACFSNAYTWKLPEGLILSNNNYQRKRFGANKKNIGKWSCGRGKLRYIDADGKEQIIEASCESISNVPDIRKNT